MKTRNQRELEKYWAKEAVKKAKPAKKKKKTRREAAAANAEKPTL